jgi:endonuclease/exonuclease/phosphatase family metal-dependent hydrolase
MPSSLSTLPIYDGALDRGGARDSLTTEAMIPPSAAVRDTWFAEPSTAERHDELLDLPILRQLEVRPAPRPLVTASAVRVAFWNAERCRHMKGTLDRLSAVRPDVLLLAEMDVGMARSHQRHTVRDVALDRDAGYVFGIEFIELTPGNDRDRAAVGSTANAAGLHGNAIVSPFRLTRPALIRFDRAGRWWRRPSSGQKRIGGRMAVVATLPLGRRTVTVAAVHLESHSDAAHRAEQMDALLDAIDIYSPGAPILIGGDLNTTTFSRDGLDREAVERRKRKLPADRLSKPVPYEPLFEVARRHGFEWTSCNVAGGPTQRPLVNGHSAEALCKLDWFLTRGLAATDPQIVPATHPVSGAPLSDHEMIAVTISPT